MFSRLSLHSSPPLFAAHDMPDIPEFGEEEVPQPTYEQQEAEHATEEQKKVQAKAHEMFMKHAPTNLKLAFAWYDSMSRNGKVQALFKVLERDPATLTREELKLYEAKLLAPDRLARGINPRTAFEVRGPAFVAKWKPFLPRVFPATMLPSSAAQQVVPLDIDMPAIEKHEKSEKGGPEVTPGNIVLKSKDGRGAFTISRRLIRDPKVSGVYAVLLEGDPKAYKIPTSFSQDELGRLVAWLQRINFKIEEIGKTLSELGEARKKELVDELDEKGPAIANRDLPGLIKTTLQIDSPILMQLFMRRYARYLHGLKQNESKEKPLVLDELRRQNFPRDVLPLIAAAYFLEFNEGIDRDVLAFLGDKKKKVVSIPSDTLMAYGKIPYWLVHEFPNLRKNPNAINDNKFTALTGVIAEGKSLQELQLLLRLRGIDVNLRDLFGGTPLGDVMNINNPEMRNGYVQALLQAGADTEARDSEGDTPLKRAVFNSSSSDMASTVQLLLDAGANVNAYDNNGMTIWSRAHERTPAAKRTKELLLKAGIKKIRYVEPGRVIPLHTAAAENDVKKIASLLAEGTKIDELGDRGSTALHVAINNEAWEAAAELIKRGANSNIQNFRQETPLDLAVIHQQLLLIQDLIAAGATVTEKQVGMARQAISYGAGRRILELLEKNLKK